ncbi:hypothetical protein FEM08_10740 [Flavobacterium gilvum]|nr:hypothetical protein FEM08_10740 [Flavobacterium gilvum]
MVSFLRYGFYAYHFLKMKKHKEQKTKMQVGGEFFSSETKF